MINNSESQLIEYKESWRDEYLKWLCGFANAQGGTLYIGVDDKGNTVGISGGKKLLEDIPNKIRDMLSIIAEVNLIKKDGKDVLEIKVEPSQFPVNYKGEYHYRSGSTKQQLTGNALNSFLMKKMGISWESAAVENVTPEQLPDTSFDIFREQALRHKRLSADELNLSKRELLDKLQLLTPDGKLTRAAYLLFAKDPNRVAFNSYIKVGYFDGPDVLYQDEVKGSLLEQAEKCIDLIFTKYLKATITYDGPTRVETFPFAYNAIREAIFNSIIHRAYNFMNPTQIRVYYNRIVISNDAANVAEDWTEEKLFQKHRSIKYNPLIADAFFMAGYIETWGRGIQKICNACAENNNPFPRYEIDRNDFTVIFDAVAGTAKDGLIYKENLIPGQNTWDVEHDPRKNEGEKEQVKVTEKVAEKVTETQQKIIEAIKSNPYLTQTELADIVGISRMHINRNMAKLQNMGRLKRVGPDKGGHWEIIEK